MEREERVAFIGISNWALDPAKMNRGIMVTRCDPTREELELSAKCVLLVWIKLHVYQILFIYTLSLSHSCLIIKLSLYYRQICTNHGKDEVAEWLKPHFSQFAEAYLEILSKQKREFFGLRDFYR